MFVYVYRREGGGGGGSNPNQVMSTQVCGDGGDSQPQLIAPPPAGTDTQISIPSYLTFKQKATCTVPGSPGYNTIGCHRTHSSTRHNLLIAFAQAEQNKHMLFS